MSGRKFRLAILSAVKALNIAAIMALAASASSCQNDENVIANDIGRMQFNVTFPYGEVTPDSVHLHVADVNGKYEHTWASINDFQEFERFYIGDYVAEAYTGVIGAEGFDAKCLYGTKEFTIFPGKTTDVQIECMPSQACVYVERDNNEADYTVGNVMLHTLGHGYIEFDEAETRGAYLQPGRTETYVDVSDKEGNTVRFTTGLSVVTEAGFDYKAIAIIDADSLMVDWGDNRKAAIKLTDEEFTTSAPTLDISGFVDNEPLHLIEGYPADNPVKVNVKSSVPLRSVVVTVAGEILSIEKFNVDVNVLKEGTAIEAAGLNVNRISDTNVEIDFTRILENMQVDVTSDIKFMVRATDELGRVSDIVTLMADIESVEFSLQYKSTALVGYNVAEIALLMNVDNVEPQDFDIKLTDGTPLQILTSELDKATRVLKLMFAVPEGTSTLPLTIYYLNSPKIDIEVEREVPSYTLDIDAFATMARVHFAGATGDVINAITKYARLYANGQELAVMDRDEDNGLLVVAGLEPDSRYEITSVIIKDAFVATENITTEKALPVPSGDFEDAIKLIDYNHMASGGIYSSTPFSIFNKQNYVDVKVSWPRNHWASINAKTFCNAAKNKNTWYMQPSAMIDFSQSVSGSKSMMIQSVGWSINGPEIEPYVQNMNEYLPYSLNIPKLVNVSAGRVFLGNYTFSAETMTETYEEGVKFTSRPSSLNGFYKFLPDVEHPDDQGYVIVELINDSDWYNVRVVAEGEATFSTAPDFRSFNVPLTYNIYNMPVTKLRIMFVSSVAASDKNITDAAVPVTADAPTARYVGSVLWIDNLSFSY